MAILFRRQQQQTTTFAWLQVLPFLIVQALFFFHLPEQTSGWLFAPRSHHSKGQHLEDSFPASATRSSCSHTTMTATTDHSTTGTEGASTTSTAKRLVCIRHARSEGNEMMAQPGNEWGDPTFCDNAELIDAKLTETGLQQVRDELLPKFIRSANTGATNTGDGNAMDYRQLLKDVDLVVVSPLTRTQETFQYGVLPALEEIYSEKDSSSNMPNILALPLSTERVYTASDTGRPVTELSKQFTWVDWSLLLPVDGQKATTKTKDWWYSHADEDETTITTSNADSYQEWRPIGEGQWYAVPGEPEDRFQTRMKELEEWIAAREENNILLVAHWGVIRYLTGGYQAKNCEVTVLDDWKPLHFQER